MDENGLFQTGKRFDHSDPVQRDTAAEKNAFLAKIKARAAKRKNETSDLPPPKVNRQKSAVIAPKSGAQKREAKTEVVETDDLPEAVIETVDELEADDDFDIFSDFQQSKKQKIAAAFPRWCQNATKIAADFVADSPIDSIQSLINPQLYQNLLDLGYSQLFPVQSAIIPQLLKTGPNRDYAIQAPTGSGKTVAFLIPIIQQIINRAVPHIRALIVLPTRELAQQVYKVLCQLTKDTKLKSHLLIGAQNFANVTYPALLFVQI